MYKKGDFGYWWTIIEGNEDIVSSAYIGDIDCSLKSLTSLKGAPKEIKGNFLCQMNKLKNLEFAPEKVDGNFDCSKNKLIDLHLSPKVINGNFIATNMQLTVLNCDDTIINGDFDISFNNLKTTKVLPKNIKGTIIVPHNKIEKLDGLSIGKNLIAYNNPYKYLELEYKLIKENPNLDHNVIIIKLFDLTNDVTLLPENIKKVFIF